MRVIFALATLAIGLYLFHTTSVYQGVLAARGQGDWSQLQSDLPFLLRFSGALTLALGGALALRFVGLGLTVTAVGVLIHFLLTAAILVAGGDISLWLDDALWVGGMIVLWAGMFVFRRK